jgi:Protein of unknown function (DUF3300)
MRALLLLFLPLCAALLLLPAQAQAQQPPNQAELDALLAPVALYPDDVVRLVLDASTAPGEVAEAAQWSRVNRGMTGEDAVRAVQQYPWQPSVKALAAYPDLLERMAESPQWLVDLGNAWRGQQASVLATVQALRERAYASGTLHSDPYQTVQASSQGIAVVPAMPYIYNVPYYDPLVIYGGWWWPAYRPVFWRPWTPRPVFVTNVFVVNRGFRGPAVFAHHNAVSPAIRFQAQNSAAFVARGQAANRPSPAAQFQNRGQPRSQVQPYHRVPESQRQPIVQSRGQPFVQSHAGPAFPQQHQLMQRPAFVAHQQFHQSGGSRQGGQHAQHRGRS